MLHNKEFGRKHKLLLVLATRLAAPKTVAQIRKLSTSGPTSPPYRSPMFSRS